MNYFAHGCRFLAEPYFLAGTAVPDWLNVADRRVRVRTRQATPFADDADPIVRAVARGIVQHHADDAWFHETPVFAELSWRFTAEIRDRLAPDPGMRPSFLGHILVELLLDAVLIAEQPVLLESYYDAVAGLDGRRVEAIVNRIAARPTDKLAQVIAMFREVQFLRDYAADGPLLTRLNGVMRRVGLAPLPAEFVEYLPTARRAVTERRNELLPPDQWKTPANQ